MAIAAAITAADRLLDVFNVNLSGTEARFTPAVNCLENH
jgi:hypothetical protein